MNSRLEKVRKLKLDVSEKAPAPARRWVLWLLLAIFVGSRAFLVFKNTPLPNSISRTVEASTASAYAAPATSTSAAPTETPRLNRFTAAGYVEPIPPFPIHVSPLVLGRIDEFTITEGQPVKAGQIIAKLNSQEFEKRLAELQSCSWRQCRTTGSGRNRACPLKKTCCYRGGTGKELEQASADAAVLRAEAVKLQAEIQTVEWQIQQTAVRAPVDGILFERLANVGSFIYSDSNREIASIYDPAKLQIWVDVNQRDVARLYVGQPVEVTLDAEPGKVFTGEVSRILPRASLSKNTIQAKILLHETSPSLRPDMSVKVTFLEKEAATRAAEKTVNCAMNPIVEIRNVHKIYTRGSEKLDVLQGVTVQVAASEFLALMGPSGSGKTTLLNLMAGIDTPTSGEVIVNGRDISKMGEDQLAAWRTRNVGYVFQSFNLVPVLTAYENVELPLLLLPLDRRRRHEQVMTSLEVVGLADRKDHLPRQLSGGQEQRVAIARAIVTDPPLVLADEPTGDLDRENAKAVMELVAALCREFNKTFVIVTHDPKVAECATRVLHMDKGVLVESAQLSEASL